MDKSDVEEAMEELGVSENAPGIKKLEATTQWILGDPEWASIMFHWFNECGYLVIEQGRDNDPT